MRMWFAGWYVRPTTAVTCTYANANVPLGEPHLAERPVRGGVAGTGLARCRLSRVRLSTTRWVVAECEPLTGPVGFGLLVGDVLVGVAGVAGVVPDAAHAEHVDQVLALGPGAPGSSLARGRPCAAVVVGGRWRRWSMTCWPRLTSALVGSRR